VQDGFSIVVHQSAAETFRREIFDEDLCSDLSVLIFDRVRKRGGEEINVSNEPQRISNFAYRDLKVQLMPHIMLSLNNASDLAMPG
jgi:hypothetical protein